MKEPCPDCDVRIGGRHYLDKPCPACVGKGIDDDGERCWQCGGAGCPICPACGGEGVLEAAVSDDG